eukprot:362423-Chlamydomonas_euryale.AAC.7
MGVTAERRGSEQSKEAEEWNGRTRAETAPVYIDLSVAPVRKVPHVRLASQRELERHARP